jgi:hypothetical protein
MRIGKAAGATLVFLMLFGGIVVYRSFHIARYECEVCVTFREDTVCRTAAAETREASIESAVTSACGTLASGMTDSIRCSNTEPASVACRRF